LMSREGHPFRIGFTTQNQPPLLELTSLVEKVIHLEQGL